MVLAAALSSVMSRPPIVVGGTAEEFWTRDEYRPTDLDLIPDPTPDDRAAFEQLGLKREGRFWLHDDIPVEFPYDETFEVRRTFEKKIAGVVVSVIGVDDLYVDRLVQTTSTENPRDVQFASALAVAATNYETLDWKYIDERIDETAEAKPTLGASMRRMNRTVKREARKALSRRRAADL